MPVSIPHFSECKPKAIYDRMNLQKNKKIGLMIPETKKRGKPFDRDFFFNIVNTIYPHSME